MKMKLGLSLLVLWTFMAVPVLAVPVLQVGVPDVSGGYVAYTTSGSDEDTAFTTGTTIVVGGKRANNVNQTPSLQLGGRYTDGNGADWTAVDTSLPGAFDTHGAILVASVPDSYDGTNRAQFKIYIDGSSTAITPFFYSMARSYPNNHFPVKNNISDFLYFDIGNFSASETVPNFANSTQSSASGEIKSIVFDDGTLNFDWIHFDVMAIETVDLGNSSIVSTIVNNPRSHDVTYNKDSGSPPQSIPEPGTLLLLGSGLIGSGLGGRVLGRRRKV